MGKKNSKQNSKYDRGWKLAKQAARNCNESFETKVKQARKKEIEISKEFINHSLKCSPNFLGCYAEDQLENLSLTSFPCFLIVNIDSSNMMGSHWIAIGIFSEKVEIFDSLGFDIFNWSRVPCSLLTFLHNISRSRRVLVSPRLQPNDSNMCGFYCIYYIIRRAFSPFINLTDHFDLSDITVNDSKLLQFFQ